MPGGVVVVAAAAEVEKGAVSMPGGRWEPPHPTPGDHSGRPVLPHLPPTAGVAQTVWGWPKPGRHASPPMV